MGSKEKILSISVAAYNVETMIEQNIKSFINSKVKDEIEVIITDDGSKDRTVEIVERYQEEYPDTIKLVKQKNTGPGSTVNSGISHATGKYFRMVDGDDWVETENLEELVSYLKSIDVDMVLTNYEYYNNEENRITETMKLNLPNKRVLRFSDICSNLHLEMHYAIFKTSILKDNNIVLDNGFYTDVEYLLLPIPFVNTVVYLDTNIYVYRIAQTGQSISIPSRQKNIKMFEQVLNRLILNYENYKNNLDENKNRYIITTLGWLSNSKLETLLTFDANDETKNKIIEFNNELKSVSKDVYKEYKKSKKAKLLIYSNYKLYSWVSKKCIKRLIG